MSENKRIITDIEYEAGRIAIDAKRSKKFKTVDELYADWSENQDAYAGVNYDDRVEFLTTNGYKVTRENLVADLPNTTTPEPDLSQALVDELESMKEPAPESE